MKKTYAFLAAVVVGILVATAAIAGTVTPFTGPAGTNPIKFPAVESDLNSLINALNAAISNGQIAGVQTGIFTGQSFQIGNVTSTGSLTLGTVFPSPSTLGSTTSKFWLTFFDSQGKLSYIPVWQ